MSERSPPLPWVHVFDAAARHGSFAAAAKELSVSAGAVSRTIRELEDFMGVALFTRKARGVALTEHAKGYAHAIRPAIRELSLAAAGVRANARRATLRVTAMPALAQRWLVPRLGEFNALHPQIDVFVTAECAVMDLARSDYDVALRYGEPQHPECEVVDLFGDELFAVMSPRLASALALVSPRDFFRSNALYDTYWESDWQAWLAAAGLQAPKRWRGLYFSLYTMAVEAAVAGQGVLIGHAALIGAELASGTLVAPFATRLLSAKRYYALVHARRAASPAVRAFLDWLRRDDADSTAQSNIKDFEDGHTFHATASVADAPRGRAAGPGHSALRRISN